MSDMDKIYTIDIETTIRNRGDNAVGDMAAAPWCVDNEIVLIGLKKPSNSLVHINSVLLDEVVDADLLIGQNIKFDLHYLYRFYPEVRKWAATGKIWDTQLAEYLLTGQQKMFVSLNELAEKYGGTLKNDRIKEYWDAGIDTTDIPMDELTEYLEDDVRNTELVYVKQRKKAEDLGMLPLIESQMEALLGTIEMEFNGMAFDTEYALEQSLGLVDKLEVLENSVLEVMREHFDDDVVLNTGSNDQLSLVLFGGSYKAVEKQPILDDSMNPILFKSGAKKGQVRTKNVDVQRQVKGLGIKPRKGWEVKKKGFYQTGEDILAKIDSDFTRTLLEMRNIKKDLTTYFEGYRLLVWPDGCIHSSLNHTSTATGRLSSSRPNLQNVSSKED